MDSRRAGGQVGIRGAIQLTLPQGIAGLHVETWRDCHAAWAVGVNDNNWLECLGYNTDVISGGFSQEAISQARKAITQESEDLLNTSLEKMSQVSRVLSEVVMFNPSKKSE